MKHYSIRNICIDYDGIQCESYLSRNRIKRAVIHGLGKDLGWFNKSLEWSRYE